MKTKILFIVGLILTCSTLLTACENTVQGFGKDMQQNGQKLENSANS